MRVFVPCFLALWLLAAPARAALVDGVVAAINDRVIALSTLEAYHTSFMPTQSSAAALETLINERLLASEATRYGQSLPNTTVTAAAAKLPVPAGLSHDEWFAMLGDHLLADRFIAFRFAGFMPIPRDQLLTYYHQHRDQFPGSFADAEETIRTALTPQVRQQQIDAYIEELRSTADVRIDPTLIPTAP